MHYRNREINIFSMSALDLFASALGAFVILTLILLPYYLKTGQSITDKQEQQRKIKQLQAQNDVLKQQNKQLQTQLENAVSFALLGITTHSKSFVIVIDMSGSMKNYAEIMVNTVERVLEPLKEENDVQLIGYQSSNKPIIHPWNKPYQLAPMDKDRKQAALRWTVSLKNHFGGTTPTHAALLEALKYPSEAIILLTDGAPNNKHPQTIVDDITKRNAGRKEIHSVALGGYLANPSLVSFLEELAKKNRGGFVGVSN